MDARLGGVDWYISNCPSCDCAYAITKRMEERRRKDGATFYCPNGHTMSWSDTEADKLRRERDRLKQDAARLADEMAAERTRADKAEAATKRLKKRTAAGTCPCCQRTFSNMGTHMRKQHPAFVAEQTENVVPMKRA